MGRQLLDAILQLVVWLLLLAALGVLIYATAGLVATYANAGGH